MREVDLRIDVSGNFDRATETQRGTRSSPRNSGETKSALHVLSDYVKVGLDFGFALIGLIALLPMIVMIVAILLVVQGRPIFIAHKRIGKDGAMFPCLKFRTMVNNASDVLTEHLASNPHLRAEWNATRKLHDDPRVTPFGGFLRKSSIDEIPQLINVVLGQMSLVGPRPIVTSEVELYGLDFAQYIQVRPGLTGLWQVSGRSDTSYSERVELDVRYVAERSTWGDIKIMLRTIPAVLQSRGSY